METKKIIIIEDNETMRKELKRIFELDDILKDFEILIAENVDQYYHLQKNHKLDVLIIDMRLAGVSGEIDLDAEGGLRVLNIFQFFRQKNHAAIAIVFTAYASIEDCVQAMRFGAWDYIEKNQAQSLKKLVGSIKEGLNKRFSTTEGPDSNWLEENLPNLAEDYGGEWVAFVDTQQVDNDKNLHKLKQRVVPKFVDKVPYFLYIPKKIFE